MPRINHVIVLLLENRSFDHLFGFFPAPAGGEIENILALDSAPVNLLDPTKPASAGNPTFEVSQPAPFAVHDKEGPSHLEDTIESVVAGVPLHPADEPLDELTENWAMGMLSLLGGGLESVDDASATQGQASAAVEAQLRAVGL